MRVLFNIFLFTVLLSSCSVINAIGYGRALSKKEKANANYFYPINDVGTKYYVPAVFMEDALFSLLNRDSIAWQWRKIAYTDTDDLLITLSLTNTASYTYSVSIYNDIASRTMLDSLINKPETKINLTAFITIGNVTDQKDNVVNMATPSNKNFPNSSLRKTLDSLFTKKIAQPLLALLEAGSYCQKITATTDTSNSMQVILTDNCSSKTTAVYTYQKKTVADKHSPKIYTSYTDIYPVRIEKFYTNFTLIDSFQNGRKVSKKILYKNGESKLVY